MAKIMIVDDDIDILFSLKESLEVLDKRYEIDTVVSGMECFEHLTEDKHIPDIILLDILMPDMNGMDVYVKLRDKPEWRDIPIIFMTATKDKKIKKRGNFIASDFIEKPFLIEDLKEKIDRILKIQ